MGSQSRDSKKKTAKNTTKNLEIKTCNNENDLGSC